MEDDRCRIELQLTKAGVDAAQYLEQPSINTPCLVILQTSTIFTYETLRKETDTLESILKAVYERIIVGKLEYVYTELNDSASLLNVRNVILSVAKHTRNKADTITFRGLGPFGFFNIKNVTVQMRNRPLLSRLRLCYGKAWLESKSGVVEVPFVRLVKQR
jgi:hypothetical protein